MHYHHNWDEWWYIVQGEWEWTVEGIIKKVKKAILFLLKGIKNIKYRR